MGKKSRTNNLSKSSTSGDQDKIDFSKLLTENKSERSKRKMSFFGDIDTDEVSGTELVTGTYLFTLTDINDYTKEQPNGEKKSWLIFTWAVTDDDSDQFGEEMKRWFTIYPNLTNEEFSSLTGAEKLQVKKHITYLKNQLKDIGIDPDRLQDFDTDMLKEKAVGTEAYIDIIVTPQENRDQPFIKTKKFVLKNSVDTVTNGTSDIDF